MKASEAISKIQQQIAILWDGERRQMKTSEVITLLRKVDGYGYSLTVSETELKMILKGLSCQRWEFYPDQEEFGELQELIQGAKEKVDEDI